MNAEWLRYYIAAKLNGRGRGHRLQPRRLRRARQQRPGRQVHQHRQPRGGLPQPSASAASCRRDLGVEGRALLDGLRAHRDDDRDAVRGARVRQGAARGHAAGRPRQRVRRPATSPGSWPSRPARTRVLHDVCTRLHRGLPPADDLPEAGAAGAGRAGRGLPAASSRCSFADARARARRAHRSATTST